MYDKFITRKLREKEESERSCDKCKNWDQGCDLDGNFRRSCKINNYIHFKAIMRKEVRSK